MAMARAHRTALPKDVGPNVIFATDSTLVNEAIGATLSITVKDRASGRQRISLAAGAGGADDSGRTADPVRVEPSRSRADCRVHVTDSTTPVSDTQTGVVDAITVPTAVLVQ